MVASGRAAFSALEATRDRIGARAVELVRSDANEYLAHSRARFDVVFLDPPFRQNALPAVLERLEGRLAPAARVDIESAAPAGPGGRWRELKRARAGEGGHQPFGGGGGEPRGPPRARLPAPRRP